VFPLLRYDNLASAVRKILRGYRREETVRFMAFRSHWRFAAEFCTPRLPFHQGLFSLEIVLCDTLKSLAMSRIGSPASRRRRASFIWCGVIFGLRPISGAPDAKRAHPVGGCACQRLRGSNRCPRATPQPAAKSQPQM
jgi:hypothetical protein